MYNEIKDKYGEKNILDDSRKMSLKLEQRIIYEKEKMPVWKEIWYNILDLRYEKLFE